MNTFVHAEELFSYAHSACLLRAICNVFPCYIDLLGIFIERAQKDCRFAAVFEPGAGTCSLANLILTATPSSSQKYVAIDPQLRGSVRPNRRFQPVIEHFLDWHSDDRFGTCLSRFTLHHFPQDLEQWYEHIAQHLLPGGIYLHIDHVLPSSNDTLHKMVDLAQSIIDEDTSQTEIERWIAHFKRDWELLVPIDTHIAAMEQAGFRCSIEACYRDQAVIRAVKER